MSERFPLPEPAPSDVEIRRDSLLLRVAELREKIKETDLDPEIVSKELTVLDTRLQQEQGSAGMKIFEEMLDTLEKIVDSRIK
jgi:hypothetical protein